jgi:rhamnulose-1-phosphate aldolase
MTELAAVAADIAGAGRQLTDLGACEGAAGNISVFTASLSGAPPALADVALPVPAPSLAGGWVVITASGRRLRDVERRPDELAVLRVGAGGRTAALHAAAGIRPSSEWNSHLAVHEDHRRRRGLDHHAVAHAQPRGLVFLSHLPDVTTTAELNARLMRWEPETTMVAPEGVELAGFQVPGSDAQMAATVPALARCRAVVWAKHGVVTRSDVSAADAADLVEYLEAAAQYELMNLSLGSPAHGLTGDERSALHLRPPAG